jgi:signal recognition particle subunit SRP54
MFEALTEKLGVAFGGLSNKGRLIEKDVDQALREVRLALLEADVNFRVARQLVSRIRERALEGDVLKSLSPGQQVVKITKEELTEVLGGGAKQITPAADPPSVMLMVGLNGAGKTTASAKIARHLKAAGQTPLLVAADLRRPAAIKQLQVLGGQVGVEVYTDDPSKPTPTVAGDGVNQGAKTDASWVIVDTAGRFQVDDDLMRELEEIKEAVSPTETLLVVDAMTGQEAVNVAEEFHSRIGLTGLVLTKLDGDARGGAALSVVSVTGVSIKFIGTGERVDALEEFHPDRLASRILGMGDVLTLIEKAQTTIDEDQAVELERKMRQATFDLEDFLGQLQQLKKMGPLSQIMEMVPGMSSIAGRMSAGDLEDGQVKHVEAIIRSMTPEERRRPELIGGSRRRRIARGSGTSPQDINQLLNRFRQMQKMMRQLTLGKRTPDFRSLMGLGLVFGVWGGGKNRARWRLDSSRVSCYRHRTS